MANSRSLFSRTSSSSRLSIRDQHLHDLPRWRTPSPMAASMIPPPIVQSTYSLPPSNTSVPTQSIYLDQPPLSNDRQTELEADLQFLLDAQANGLVRGYVGASGDYEDRDSTTGSTTPTITSASRAGASHRGTSSARRASKKTPGLRSARRGIYSRIVALSALKSEELGELDEDVREKEGTLERISQWETKRRGLESASTEVRSDEDAVRAKRLQQQADALQEDINNVELQLSEMKARHRKLMRQVSAVENAVEARQASYTTSLRMLEEEVLQFLSTRPSGVVAKTENAADGSASMWQLPPKRRTLDMAREHWNHEREATLQRRQSVEFEKAALDEAAPIWKDVCTQVNGFELRLKTEMSRLTTGKVPSPDSAAWEEQEQKTTLKSDNQAEGLQDVLKHLSTLIESIETKLALSRERSWNLLIAAIGAELDALIRGRSILEEILHPSKSRDEDDEELDRRRETSSDAGAEIHALDESFETTRHAPARSESEVAGVDDDPDPELLFSHHEESEGD